MNGPLGYLLTWTCYGTWLHGDERGSVDDEHNVVGGPRVPESEARYGAERMRLAHAPVRLSDPMRRVVLRAVVEHCAVKGVELEALSVRTNHVHAVVSAGKREPGRFAGELKAWATRRLREAGLMGEDDQVWTKRSSTPYLWDTEAMLKAIDYVTRLQGPPDEFTIRRSDLHRASESEPPAAAGGWPER